ncbi:unnamed protein product [Lathyrus sativus]|nr:unnamed protein product [Lathyrus sativus]
MAKQKIVIKVTMKNEKSRIRAMKIAVGVYGVESAAIQGDNKDEIVVTGVGVDPVKLTRLLRKKFCIANLTSVGDLKEEKKKEETSVAWPNCVPHYNWPVCEIRNQYEEPCNCSIM